MQQIIPQTSVSADYWNVWDPLANTTMDYIRGDEEARKDMLRWTRRVISSGLKHMDDHHRFQTYSSFCQEEGENAPNLDGVRDLDSLSQQLTDYLRIHAEDPLYDFECIRQKLMTISQKVYGHVAKKLL